MTPLATTSVLRSQRRFLQNQPLYPQRSWMTSLPTASATWRQSSSVTSQPPEVGGAAGWGPSGDSACLLPRPSPRSGAGGLPDSDRVPGPATQRPR